MESFALATDDGVVICQRHQNNWTVVSRSLARRKVTSVIAREGVILVGTRDGIARSGDGGQTWTDAGAGLATPLVRWMAFHPDQSDLEFAGTEPAGIFVSHDGGGSWRSCQEVEAFRDRGRWFLPYSPEAGCVRGFAFHGSRVYAAVEVGGVLRSDDSGETWRLVDGTTGMGTLDQVDVPQVHSDVHSINSHPSSPEVVLAATNSGLYMSVDGGSTWRVSHARSYCRAVWFDPEDLRHVILGPADGVSRGGRIEESFDGGESWLVTSSGLGLPWPQTMVERFFHFDSNLFAVTSDGRLFASSLLDPLEWTQTVPAVHAITGMAQIRG